MLLFLNMNRKKKKILCVVALGIFVSLGAYVDSKTGSSAKPEIRSASIQENQIVAENPSGEKIPENAAISAVEKKYAIDANYDVVPLDPNGNKKIVLLTMDDGPKNAKTLRPILATLKEKDVHLIFFVLGNFIKAHPELLKEMNDAGHTIGNHTWDHANLKKLEDAKGQKALDDTTAIIESTLGFSSQFFRPPYGTSTPFIRNYAKDKKMLFMNWSQGGEDWIKKYETADALMRHVIEQLHPGANILIHELPWTEGALSGIIDGIREKGYEIIDPKEIETLE